MRKSRRRKRKQMKLIVFTIILCLLPAVILSAIVLQKKISPAIREFQSKESQKKPDQLLKQYYAYIEKGNYKEMYEILSADSKTKLSSEDFITRNKNIYEGIKASNIQVQVTDTEEGEEGEILLLYKVSMETAAGEISFSNLTAFKAGEEKGEPYGIGWDDSMIFPEFFSTDKVRISREEPKRGNILDREGKILAGEGTAVMVGLVPGKMNPEKENDMIKLAEILSVSPESIAKKLEAKWVKEDSFVPIKTVEKLTELEVINEEPNVEILAKKQRDEALLAIPGVMLSDTKVREYPLRDAASHLTGYLQKVTAEDLEKYPDASYNENSMIGKSGMETLYENELKGEVGYKIVITDEGGTEKSVLANKTKLDGTDLSLTIDSVLQKTIYDTYKEDKSCTVALNPYTGEVLALVSTPSFDSTDFILGMSEPLWNSLNQDERKPLYNRFRQKLCPGSSLKPIIGAIGLKTGDIVPQEDYGNEGLSWQKDKSWGNYEVTTLHPANPANLENAIVYSDNIYFAKAALRMGKNTLKKELKQLGFGEELPFEIATANSQFSNTENIESEILLADSGYGQGQILVNPIHLAALYTGFANEGNIIQPYLRYQENAKGEVWKESAYGKEQATMIKEAMRLVVESSEGTGHGAFLEDVSLAAKTGTAEIKLSKEDKTGTELGWFGIFTEDPNVKAPILILTMVEDVKGRGGSGYVVNKTKEILEQWFTNQ